MRLTPIALSAAIMLATVASAGYGQKPDDQIDPRSTSLTQQAQALSAQGRYSDATDLLETALAVDPRNRQAYIALGRAAQGEKLPGKAIKFYLEALKLEPNDLTALAGQGEALVQRGAVERAKRNLERIRTLCKGPCPQATTLAAAIAKGPPPEVLTAQRPEVGAPTSE
ncbi:MAG: tetratricopeptide repeat protein [Alphaproteobacteria bacterium]|nr:tetratricopeptide repeat protein [Alphaproteobacteria bacterium]MBV9372457.1 tetratricopeptide repeat protein [Alphaproteobacteria bacterium]MBV9902132.1 tetratricopeptide repeat protein [Alphaproteobacteria bacterium]